MMRTGFLIVLWFSFLPLAYAENCVDGLWAFDNDESDNVEKIQREIFKRAEKGVTPEDLGIPAFVFSSAELQIKKNVDEVVIKFLAADGEKHHRYFSTVGKTKSVSLKSINSGNNTVVASWEKDVLIVETTTPQGVYIEEKFTLQRLKNKPQRLLIHSRLKNRVGLRLQFEKIYQQADVDWLACQKLSKS
ncbi:MAG: hypothetical protein HRU20_14855 [Pseudomonadales bacterium]|nr:hypothetical protein [Pseudomonadales bacterium]